MPPPVSASPDILARCRAVADPALRAAVDGLSEPVRRIARYHFAWCDEHGNPTGGGAGKAIRPALAMLSAEAAGGRPSDAVAAAVAVELVHNFSLLHDDIMDGDTTRRHRPTAWTVFGVDAAILAGDALSSLAAQVLAESGRPAANALLSTAVLDLIDGQCQDLELAGRDEVSLAEVLRMSRNKTGALMRCCCALGALFGGGTRHLIDHIGQFGADLGLAFQFVDDLLGIWGDPAVTGKPVYSDLRNRKKSLPVVAALTEDTEASRELRARYRGSAPLPPAELARTAALIDRAGARSWSRRQAERLVSRAIGHLRRAGVADTALDDLTTVAWLATCRDN